MVYKRTIWVECTLIGRCNPDFVKVNEGVTDLVATRDLVEDVLIARIWPYARLENVLVSNFKLI